MKRLSNITVGLAKIIVVVAIVSSIAWAAMTHGERYAAQITSLRWSTLVVGLAVCCAYRICNAHGWWLVLRALRQRLPAATALKLWLSSEACRWLPGSVWSFGSRALLGAHAGVEPVAAATSVALELILTIAAWAAVSVACALLSGTTIPAVAWPVFDARTVGCGLGLAVTALLVAPWVWRWGRSKCAGKLKRADNLLGRLQQSRPHVGRCFGAFSYYVLMVCFNGLGLCCVIHLQDAGSVMPLAAVIGANAIAWLAGFFAVIAPGGLVVREGSLAAACTIWMPLEQAIAIAVLWRLLQIGAELICAALLFVPSAIDHVPHEKLAAKKNEIAAAVCRESC